MIASNKWLLSQSGLLNLKELIADKLSIFLSYLLELVFSVSIEVGLVFIILTKTTIEFDRNTYIKAKIYCES